MSTFSWRQKGIIYPICPLSFHDSHGDGYGDLPGILARLEYLKWLGIQAIWLAPIAPSPMVDWGYDVRDYTGIDPLFGSMADFDRLLAACHVRELKLILDFVPNHTSDEHPWFLESRSSRHHPRRGWSIWKDPAPGGGPPNNWLSTFGGSAWEWDEMTKQYYCHIFSRKQPDLNWRNPEVQAALAEVMRFWLDKGVDGFRVDAIWHLMKDAQFRDDPPNPKYREGEMIPYQQLLPIYSANQQEGQGIAALMREVMNAYKKRVLIGETCLPMDELVEYYGRGDARELDLPYNFHLMTLPWEATQVYAEINKYVASMPPFGWPDWVLSNHDKPRVVTRIGSAQARIAAILLLMLRGTPTIYYGDEIGTHDVWVPPDRQRDLRREKLPGGGFGRDGARTPMQWNAQSRAGFTTGQPWLPVAEDHERVNVDRQRHDDSSMLALYRRLIQLRQQEPALHIGRYAPAGQQASALALIRQREDDRFLSAVNLGRTGQELSISPSLRVTGRIVLGTDSARTEAAVTDPAVLRAHEGITAKVTD